MSKVGNYLRASYDELRYKVTWPSYAELQRQAVLVLVGSLIIALYVGVLDYTFEGVLKWFYELLF